MHLPRIATLTFLTAALFSATSCAKKAAGPARANNAPPQPVEVVTIARHDLVESLDLIGTIMANESAQIRAEVAGLVREIHFMEGQTVTKDQVLLKIDDTELAAQTLQTEATRDLAKSNYDRSAGLLTTHINTPAEHERAAAELKSAEAQLALLRSRLAKTEIRAPFAGTIGARAISPGDYVTSQSSITTVDDLSKLKIEFEVPELYLRRIRPGTTFTVTVGGESQAPVQGEVYFVSTSINRETRSSVVKGLLLAPSAETHPGMFANVRLVLDVHRGALSVPEGSILNTTSGPRIVIVDGPADALVAKFVPVTLGLRAEGQVEVTAKTTPLEGRQVVAAGVGALALVPGMKLAPKPAANELINAKKD